MKKVLLALVALCVCGVAHANPDGPPGTLILTPKFAINTDNDSTSPTAVALGYNEERDWGAGMAILLPISSFVTLGGDFLYREYTGSSGGLIRGDTVVLRADRGVDATLIVRFYIPLTGDAREQLKAWR